MQVLCPSCEGLYSDEQAAGLCPRCLAAVAALPSEPGSDEIPFEKGDTFHGLKIEHLVARGGMGVVYRAREPVFGKPVALKVLSQSLAAEAEFRQRFDHEARALAGLSHPNIVNLYDFGIDEDLMFLVMEFVEGVSLRQYLKENTLPPDRAIKIALQLCEALHFAHREGVIHRDLKPENVLVDRSGRVKLADFGLAKRLDGDATQLTQTDQAMGTPHYMAPEQLERPRAIDHRVDIYSMGVLLYEMLTRELPLGRFPPPSSKKGVDERLDDIVYRCLDKDPDRRYPTIVQLKNALLSAIERSAEDPIRLLQEDRAPVPRQQVKNAFQVTCRCGWAFLVPVAARRQVHCPSCGEPVALEAGGTASLGALPRSGGGTLPWPRVLAYSGLGILLLAAGLLALSLASHRSAPASEGAERAEHDPVRPARQAAPPRPSPVAAAPLPAASAAPAKVPSSAPPESPAEAFDAAGARREAKDLACQINLAGLVSSIFRSSGRSQESDQVEGQMRQLEERLQSLRAHLVTRGQDNSFQERMRAGDEIVAFAGQDAEPPGTPALAEKVSGWLRAFLPGSSVPVTVLREHRPVSFTLEFADRAPELVALARQAGIILGETPGEILPAPEVQAPLPQALADDLLGRVRALHPFYWSALPYEERGRASALLTGRRGSSDDRQFLSERFCELLRRCEAEYGGFKERVQALEVRLSDPAAATDTLVCKDGRKIEGLLLEENAESVTIQARLGPVAIRRDEILGIEKGKGSASEFRTAYQAGRGQKSELVRLEAFARERKLGVQQDLARFAILVVDPGDERCRAAVGLGRSPFEAAPQPRESGLRLEYHGRLYTPEQLRQELHSVGYVQVNGLWCERISRTLKIDNLYRDEGRLPVRYSGTSVLSQMQHEKESVYDYRSRTWVPRTKQVALAWYIGGSGYCLIEVSAPGDLIDCHIRARSQVSRVGSVAVSVLLDSRDPNGKTLFSLTSPGEHNSSCDASDKVAGHRSFMVRADVKGDGMFLVSDSNELGVFEASYSYGKPIEWINALFERQAAPPREGALGAAAGTEEIEAICRRLALSASSNESFIDALSEVRKLGQTLSYEVDFAMPERFRETAARIRDPLVPDWNGRSKEELLSMGSWWNALPQEERREFLAAYGLWCARTRFLRSPK